MRILAWYIFAFTIFSIIVSIASKDTAGWRLFAVLLNIPILIFIIKYLFY